jgi:hypothetical protein
MPIIPSQQKFSRQVVPLGLAGGAYTNLSSNVNAQTCINWYVVPAGPGARTKAALYPTPGTTLVQSVGAGPHRGAIEHKGKTYFVSGAEFIEMDAGGNFTAISGVLPTTSGRVDMCSNGDFGDQVLVVDGADGYVFNGTTLAVIADSDFPANPTSCVYLDGRAIVTFADSGVWYISDLNDFTAWTATQFANAERDPDNLVRAFVNNRDLILFGDYTTEIGTNTGASPFPFEMYSNGLFDIGCAARFSVAKASNKVHWLSQDRRGKKQIQVSTGTDYKPLSTPAVDYQISTYESVSDAHAFTYAEYGMDFYQITFPTAGVTWVCNLTVFDVAPEFAWFQKKTGSSRHVASTYVYYNNTHYVGAWDSSNIYSMESGAYLDDTTAITRERALGVVATDINRRLRHYGIEFMFEAGTGLVSGQGSDPQIALDWSDDGGHVWSNARTMSLGEIGEYGKRMMEKHLGSARQRIYRIRASDPVKLVGSEAYLDVEELLH